MESSSSSNNNNNNGGRGGGSGGSGGGRGGSGSGSSNSNTAGSGGGRGRYVGRAYQQATGTGRVNGSAGGNGEGGSGRGGRGGRGDTVVRVQDSRPPSDLFRSEARLVDVNLAAGEVRHITTTRAAHIPAMDLQNMAGVPENAVWEQTFRYRGVGNIEAEAVRGRTRARQQRIRNMHIGSLPLPFLGGAEQQQQQGQLNQQLQHFNSGSLGQLFSSIPRRTPTGPSSGSGVAVAPSAPLGCGSGASGGARSRGGIRKTRGGRGRPGGQGRPRPQQNQPCGNCGGFGHKVSQCCHPWADGFIHGCPHCNAADHHTLAQCQAQWPTNFRSRLVTAVFARANRPPLLAYRNWPEIVQGAFPRGFSVERLPWTPWYAQQMLAAGPVLRWPWQNVDYVIVDADALPQDPSSQRVLSSIQSGDLGDLELLTLAMSLADVATEGGPWDMVQALPAMPVIFPALDVEMGNAGDGAGGTGGDGAGGAGAGAGASAGGADNAGGAGGAGNAGNTNSADEEVDFSLGAVVGGGVDAGAPPAGNKTATVSDTALDCLIQSGKAEDDEDEDGFESDPEYLAQVEARAVGGKSNEADTDREMQDV